MTKLKQKRALTYRLMVNDDDNDITGINKISIVADPATEVKGYAFSKEKEYQFSDSDKMVIVGAVMTPKKLMKRKDDDGSIYYAYYEEEDIRIMAKKFMRSNKNTAFNFEHSDRSVDAYLMETWIIDHKEYDKSKIYGYDLPVGTLMMMVKITDKEFWEEEVKGGNQAQSFSLEGWFNQQLQFNKIPEDIDDVYQLLSELDNELSNELKKKFDSFYDTTIVDELVFSGLDDCDEFTEDDEVYEAMLNDVGDSALEMFADIESTPDTKSAIDKGMFRIRYKFSGKLNPNSRTFCSKLINANKIYRLEDIEAASNKIVNAGFGIKGANTYNILLYKGGPRCKHTWQRVIFFRKRDKGKFLPEGNDERLTVSAAIKKGLILNKQDNLVSIQPNNMPNNGFYN